MASPRALVHHDDPRVTALAGSLLAAEGFAVSVPASRYGLLEVAPDAAPDLLVLGLGGFDADDLEIVGVLRRRWARAFLLVVFHASARDLAARSLDLGADATLQEPFYPSELAALARRSAARALPPAATPTAATPAAAPTDDTLSKLAAGTAHSIRNPLQILELQLGSYEADAKLDVGAMREQIARIAAVTEGLTRFGGRRKPQTRLLDLNVLVRRVFADGPARPRPVRFAPAADRIEVLGAPDLLRAALEAVHERAQRETPEGAEVVVTTALVDEGGLPAAEVRVCDGGPSLAPEHLARFFDPFPEGDQVSPGTGIEMAAAAGIVRSHGGSAAARAGAHAGTEVVLRLPVHGRTGAAPGAADVRT